MELIYFPFTTISPPALAKFGIWEAPLILYAPTKADVLPDITERANAGHLSIRIPVIAGENKLHKLVKDYAEWARQHSGDAVGIAAFKATHGDGVPFFDDTYVASIRSAIKTPATGQQFQAKEAEHLFKARLFLLLAQQFDMQRDGLNRDFDKLVQMEHTLFNELKGVDKQADIEAPQKEDRGAQMTAERLSAWSHLFLAGTPKPLPTDSSLFITDSPAVFEYLLELVPTLKPAFKINDYPAFIGNDPDTTSWRKAFNAYLKALASQPETPVPKTLVEKNMSTKTKGRCTLTVAVAPFISPAIFSQICTGAKTDVNATLFLDQRQQSTLIGVIA
jgi:hypothetical protein